MSSFYFEAKIVDGGDDFNIGIGLTSSLPQQGTGFPQDQDASVVGLCLNDGKICKGNSYTSGFKEKTEVGDVIGIFFTRAQIGDSRFNLCQFLSRLHTPLHWHRQRNVFLVLLYIKERRSGHH